MGEPSEGERFRRRATATYRVACGALAAFVVAAAGVGWHVGGGWGLAIAGVVGVPIAVAGGFAATLLWAMSQDGA